MWPGRSFFQKLFFWKFVLAMKDGMSGMLQQVRLGQVRKARKSSIIQTPPPPFHVRFSKFRKNRQIRGHTGGVRWWKNWLRGLFKQVRLGQVRKAIKSRKSEAWGPPIHLLTCFGQKFERTVFERTTSSQCGNTMSSQSPSTTSTPLNSLSPTGIYYKSTIYKTEDLVNYILYLPTNHHTCKAWVAQLVQNNKLKVFSCLNVHWWRNNNLFMFLSEYSIFKQNLKHVFRKFKKKFNFFFFFFFRIHFIL